MTPKVRILELLKPGATLNGLDYIEVREAEPMRLHVHFLNAVVVHQAGVTATITGGDITPEVDVAAIAAGDWSTDEEGRQMLALTVSGRGDFSIYTVAIQGAAALDPHLSSVAFSFFAFCTLPVDCATPNPHCALTDEPPPPIDYLAKDFDSFRAALLDFSALRYPEWRERSEADFGVVMLEALSFIGDELSYIQDEGHRQARIETATSRRAVTRLARLVDYEPSPVMSATTLLRLTVTGTAIPAGLAVSALAPDGSEVPFETGTGLTDTSSYAVSPLWNAIVPYGWDDNERCLDPGTTSLYVEGNGYGFQAGQSILIDTQGPTTADPPVRQVVQLVDPVTETTDPLFGTAVTRLVWRDEDALARHHDLTRTILSGNIVPATQGRRYVEVFAIQSSPAGNPAIPLAIARLGPNSTADEERWRYFHSLAHAPLAYLPGSDGKPRPEVILNQIAPDARRWTWVRRLLDAGRAEECFTVEPGRYQRVKALDAGIFHDDDGSDGALVSFGGNDFGEMPNDGDVFSVTYRESRGLVGILPADTITSVDAAASGIVVAATNPFPTTGAADAETIEQLRRRAPYAFQASTYRAVRPEDYSAAARQLPWVQRAGTVFRWTGSWPTIFTTVDPKGTGVVDGDQEIKISALLNRYRLAGYETYAPAPRYVSFDLDIVVCAKADAFPGDVYAGVDKALRPVQYPDGTLGFFHFDNFTLGTPFQRSRLEAAIQQAPGVAGVIGITYRRRGTMTGFGSLPMTVAFGPGEIFRLDNDNNHPERGSYRIDVRGGK